MRGLLYLVMVAGGLLSVAAFAAPQTLSGPPLSLDAAQLKLVPWVGLVMVAVGYGGRAATAKSTTEWQ